MSRARGIDFSLPVFFLLPIQTFPCPTICSWVSEGDSRTVSKGCVALSASLVEGSVYERCLLAGVRLNNEMNLVKMFK